MMNDFSKQYAVPINTSEVNWNILGLIEIQTNKSGKMFEVFKSVTISEFLDFINKKKLEHTYETYLHLADLKQIKMFEAIEELRQKIEQDFSVEIKKFEHEDKVVQLVKIPICFLDLAPGDTQIYFKVFTERRLGTLDELEEKDAPST